MGETLLEYRQYSHINFHYTRYIKKCLISETAQTENNCILITYTHVLYICASAVHIYRSINDPSALKALLPAVLLRSLTPSTSRMDLPGVEVAMVVGVRPRVGVDGILILGRSTRGVLGLLDRVRGFTGVMASAISKAA